MTDTTTIIVAFITAAGVATPSVMGYLTAKKAVAIATTSVAIAQTTRDEVVEVKHNTNHLTENLVRLEKTVSFKEGEAAEKERER
jgi:hypothetical protein